MKPEVQQAIDKVFADADTKFKKGVEEVIRRYTRPTRLERLWDFLTYPIWSYRLRCAMRKHS